MAAGLETLETMADHMNGRTAENIHVSSGTIHRARVIETALAVAVAQAAFEDQL